MAMPTRRRKTCGGDSSRDERGYRSVISGNRSDLARLSAGLVLLWCLLDSGKIEALVAAARDESVCPMACAAHGRPCCCRKLGITGRFLTHRHGADDTPSWTVDRRPCPAPSGVLESPAKRSRLGLAWQSETAMPPDTRRWVILADPRDTETGRTPSSWSRGPPEGCEADPRAHRELTVDREWVPA